MSKPSVPQTVSFKAVFEYRQIERIGTGKPETVTVEFDDFCEMIQAFHKEKRRRKLEDRCTGGSYRQVLTDHGRAVCDADEYRRRSHSDAIEGTWFKL